jgi:hypothetical protein
VFRSGDSSGSQLVWILRAGRHVGAVGAPAYNQQVVLSPSGTRAAVQRIDTDTGNADLWIVDVATGIASRMTPRPGARRGSGLVSRPAAHRLHDPEDGHGRRLPA